MTELSNKLSISMVKGSTWRISFVLTDAGVPVPLTSSVIYFAITEYKDGTPFLEVHSDDIGQTIIAVVGAAGAVAITVPPEQSQPPFQKGFYAVGQINVDDEVDYFFFGELEVINTGYAPVEAV